MTGKVLPGQSSWMSLSLAARTRVLQQVVPSQEWKESSRGYQGPQAKNRFLLIRLRLSVKRLFLNQFRLGAMLSQIVCRETVQNHCESMQNLQGQHAFAA